MDSSFSTRRAVQLMEGETVKRKDNVGNIFDPSFRYVPAAATDIRKTFERERKRLKAAAAKREQVTLVPLLQKRKKGSA